MSIIDHAGFAVSDYDRSLAFYREALGTLGIKVLSDMTFGLDRVGGFGKDRPEFWISSGRPLLGETHVAFVATSHAEVQAFYSVATSMGGRDNGAPGIRAQYHPNYYAAYVFDPDGNNIEAVCYRPEVTS